MRKMIAAIAVLLALLFAPALWGLPPPGEQVPAELAWGLAANPMTTDANVAEWTNMTLEAVATLTLATMPPTGGVRLVTLKSALGPGVAPWDHAPERGPRGSPWAPAGCARR